MKISVTNLVRSVRHDVIDCFAPGKSDEAEAFGEFGFWVFGHDTVNNFPKLRKMTFQHFWARLTNAFLHRLQQFCAILQKKSARKKSA